MIGDASDPSDSVFRAILSWSADRPMWLRDGLRRVIQETELSQSDIEELCRLCKAEHGILPPESKGPSPNPATRTHVPSSPTGRETVRLTGISNARHVNALAPNQELGFGETGITVIYGDNASGKSGYARILKRACRARSRGSSIEANIYDPEDRGPASARIGYMLGDTRHEVSWEDQGDKPVEPLSSVSVFDAQCASIQVSEDNEIAFKPFGLDVPDRLARVAQLVRAELQREQEGLHREQSDVFSNPRWNATTTVGRLLGSLGRSTDLEHIKSLATLSDDENSHFEQLRSDLARDPSAIATELRLRESSVRRIIDLLHRVDSRFSDEPIAKVQALLTDARDKGIAAHLAAAELFRGEPLAGVGTETWKQLWEAARRYSEQQAYPEVTFPVIGDDARCVLCQQLLSDGASDRLTRFEDFVRADTEQEARRSLAQAREAVGALAFIQRSTREYGDSIKQLALESADAAVAVRRYLVSARLRGRALRQAFTTGKTPVLVRLPPSPATNVAQGTTRLAERVEELTRAAKGPERQGLEDELKELQDRIYLSSILPHIEAEIERLKRIRDLTRCVAETNTAPITHLGNSLAEDVVTRQLRGRFAREIGILGGGQVRVELARAGGRYGAPYYRVQLIQVPSARVGNVLSEGEHTCVALAGFLTELATAEHNSALVFDDPVSSLDHKWRTKVARRLVDEAANRQIIVFTHDIVFLHDMLDGADRRGVAFELRQLRRTCSGVGVVEQGIPWKAMRVEQRLDELEKEARAARAWHEAGDEARYAKAAAKIYNGLRATWERALEYVAFQRIVLRHRDYIDTKNLKKITVLTEQDCETFHAEFGKCCNVTNSHDPSAARNPITPDPAEMLQDIQALDEWVRSLRDRQKRV